MPESFSNSQPLRALVESQQRGESKGIYAVCSAHPAVLQTALGAVQAGECLLIEATCNQVNQFGGYTGMTPAAFAESIQSLAARQGFPSQRILLGGDHLGPNPWRKEPAQSALDKASQMIAAYASAGFAKLHLDASMACADDGPLAPEQVAARAADLCLAAEAAQTATPPVYVIGTEVPPPGGAKEGESALQVTRAADALETIQLFRAAFAARGLEDAWQRVIALVVQPGVEFGDAEIHPYQRSQATDLSRAIQSQPGLVYEAHSTDYQTRAALRQLVEDHFAILKVGPGLTFAYREALFALAHIEQEWLGRDPGVNLSHLLASVEQTMLAEPRDWADYYAGTPAALAYARKYSLSDRIRYYWQREPLRSAVEHLLHNLEQPGGLPLALLSQYLPREYAMVREGRLSNHPTALLRAHVQQVLDDYTAACR